MATLTLPRPAPPAAEPRNQRERRAEEHRRMRGLLRELGCTVFDHGEPLKIGIHDDLLGLLDGEVPPAALKRFLARHCSGTGYQVAVMLGRPRRDLAGTEAGWPTAADQDHACQCLAAIQAKRQCRETMRRHTTISIRHTAIPNGQRSHSAIAN